MKIFIVSLNDSQGRWYMDAVFAPAVTDQVPEQARGKACICANVQVMNEEELLKISTFEGLLFQSTNQLPNSSGDRTGKQS